MLIDSAVSDANRNSGYRYTIDVPADTGFQINRANASNAKKCDWGSPPASTLENVTLGTDFYIVRCKLGTGTASVTVRTWDVTSSPPRELTPQSWPIEQSWHRNDNEVVYHVMGTSGNTIIGVNPQPTQPWMFPNTRPPNLSPTRQPNPELLMLSKYVDAATKWNNANTGVTISRAAGPRDILDVVIKGYWDANPSNGIDPHCNESVACVHFTTGMYPHIANRQPLWIEDPPRRGHMIQDPNTGQYSLPAPKEWTSNLIKATTNPQKYEHLPSVLMHEFGHTIGLGHSATPNTLMSSAVRTGLHPEDRKGAEAIYQNHADHT